eukprot:GGOE01014262.1.p1 GENE.GGOE01014262.1~~GGOE01014262.1.p1  ORF type:complete len:332 (-),score=81.94 GGOE01014262.1:119-1114(-)
MMQAKELVGCNPNESTPLENPASLPDQVQPIIEFFRNNTCYDFLPNSSEVVVVDIDLPLRYAFSVAQDNNLIAASLWDSRIKRLVGMLTITDYVKMLLHFRDDPDGMHEFWTLPIRTWYQSRPNKPMLPNGEIVHCGVEDSLLEALRLLNVHKVHRLPALHGGNLLHAICRPSILSYFVANYPLDAPIFSYSVGDLKIGTFNRIFTGTPHTPLFTLLDTCVKKAVSSIPIVNEKGVLLDVFSRQDVMNIAVEGDHSMDSTIAEINSAYYTHEVLVCKIEDSLRAVLQHLMRSGAQRLICVDDNKVVQGIVSVEDIFKFFIDLTGVSKAWEV